MSEQESLKQRFEAAQGKPVGDDIFLYSCLEFERTHYPTPDELEGEHMWPRLPHDPNNCDPELFNREALEPLIIEMMDWYRDEYPELSASAPIDHEQMIEIMKPVVLMAFDLEKLVRIKTKRHLPSFRKGDENVHPFWQLLEKVLGERFEARYQTYLLYFQWCHADTGEDDTADMGSRPPVGRFGGMPPRPSGGGGPRGRQGRSAGGGGGRNDRRGRRDFSGGGGGGGRFNNRRPHGNAERFGGNDRHSGDRPPPSREDQAQYEERALKDVATAVRKLRADDTLEEVPLRPTNSFLRRLQHNHITKSGFFSYSTGDGRDRGVVVSRTRPLGYEPEGVDLGDDE